MKFLVNVDDLRDITTPTHFTKLVSLVGENKKIEYETASNIEVFPNNTIGKIERMLKIINIPGDSVFTVTSKEGQKLPIPSPMSVRSYVIYFIDLNGQVNLANMLKFEELLSPKKFARFDLVIIF